MEKLETQIYDGTLSLDAMDIRQVMNLVELGRPSFPNTVEATPSVARKLCNVMSAYRLMDVLYALQHPPASFQNPRYGKLPQKGLLPEGRVRIPHR
jgi:hypothetical protein